MSFVVSKHAKAQPFLPSPAILALAVLVSGCEGVQSTFDAFGAEAETTLRITWAMIAGAALLTAAVLALAAYAAHAPAGRLDFVRGNRLILWCGAIGPTVLLTVLLVYSLPKMQVQAAESADLEIAVEGEQFWWRVRYVRSGARTVETANEIRLPVDRTVRLRLTSADVIHSLWIPGLAGKRDMIPGRSNELVVRATRAGVFRGACTEFCGLSHARMAFDVIAMESAEFDAWLDHAARPAREVAEARGRELYAQYGCGGCHIIRGHHAGSAIGPDLTHFGSRHSLGAATLPMTVDAISAFVRNPAASKPGARMPAFAEMPADDAAAIARYLAALH